MHKVTDIDGLGYLQFYDNELPGLPAGHYEVEVNISLPAADTNNYQQSNKQAFDVQAPQFSIDTQEIHAMFPGNNANGDFSQVLPVISFLNTALPWERLITKDNTIPWMALLVFSENELNIDPKTKSPVVTTTVAELLQPTDGILKPMIDRTFLSDDILSGAVNTIIISTAVFQAVTPRLNELSTLARWSIIDPTSQAINNEQLNNSFAEVMANRFPQSSNISDGAGAMNYVQLVSLEGLTDYLTDDPEWPVQIAAVQLVSLASWSFISAVQPGQTFAELATALITSAGDHPDNLLLRIPVTENGNAAANRINDGYTALSYQTITGTASFCWYRGPFTPFPPVRLPGDIIGYLQPAAAMIYDETTGIFDNSYSAAWTIGRAMALADPVLVGTLQQMRNKVIQLNARIIERSFMPHLSHIQDAAGLIIPGISRKLFLEKLPQLQNDLALAFDTPLKTTPVSSRNTNALFPDAAIPTDPAERFTWFLQQPSIQEAIAAQLEEEITPAAGWLAKLALLEGVPFNHLVPDQRMLPVESVRFFFIDDNWIEMLLQGAFSAGIFSKTDQQIHQWLAPILLTRIKQKAAKRRKELLKVKTEEDVSPALPVAGMILRSALLTSWPSIQVEATKKEEQVDIARMENLAANMLLLLWKDIPDQVTISQPDQGLSYGVEDEWKIALRSLDSSNLGAPLQLPLFPETGDLRQFMRPVTNDIGKLVLNLVPQNEDDHSCLIPALTTALSQTTSLTSSQFTIEMVKTPEQIVFNASLTGKKNNHEL
ncbi:hypothetical protein [Chitinophaga sp. RAB17]|uniref:hypothetical protein n=1 Tax=Chitinophaga sp. RAB17 TaxID=3233049 RepID=UPI003F8EB50B